MVFSIPTYNCIGDDYDKKINQGKEINPIDSKPFISPGIASLKQREKQVLTLCQNDEDFSMKLTTNSETNNSVKFKVIQNGKSRREIIKENSPSNKWITPSGFKSSSKPTKISGLGSYHGTFEQKPLEYQCTNPQLNQRSQKYYNKKQFLPRNIVTSPSKNTNGFIGLDKYEYIAHNYNAQKEIELKDNQSNLIQSNFKPVSKSYKYFDEIGNSGISGCYKQTKPLTDKQVKLLYYPDKIPALNSNNLVPWKPNGPAKDISKNIKYYEEPKIKKYCASHSAKKEINNAPWKPNSNGNDIWYTKSIIFNNL